MSQLWARSQIFSVCEDTQLEVSFGHGEDRARFFAEHAPLQSTLLYAPLQSTLLCRALSFAEHSPLQSTLLCRARSFAEHASLQSTLLCRALSFAEQSTLLCRARFFAEHASLQSTLLCRARSSAEHASLQSTLPCSLCRALSFAGMETSQLRARSQIFSACEDPQLDWGLVNAMNLIWGNRVGPVLYLQDLWTGQQLHLSPRRFSIKKARLVVEALKWKPGERP